MELKLVSYLELILISAISILCGILLMKSLFKLRSILPWRVNCWFCNHNFWIKFILRNCWTCPKCEQYNGFNKDGDYNKTLFVSSDQPTKSSQIFRKSTPKNGLCKMCNINQELKIVQLANFVPINEKNFDQEIDSYKVLLEKAYKLCGQCKIVLQKKLHKEKETLLGTKLLENRTPDKKNKKSVMQNHTVKSTMNNISMMIAGVLITIVFMELLRHILRHNNLQSTVINLKDVTIDLIERILSIIKIKILYSFPFLQDIISDFHKLLPTIKIKEWFLNEEMEHYSTLAQKGLGGLVCFIQIIGHMMNINQMKYSIVIDLLWTVFVIATIFRNIESIDPIIICLVKLTSALAVILVYKKFKSNKSKVHKILVSPKNMKNLVNGSVSSVADDDDTLSLDTDDDVSLCKFGLHNFSDSSNETVNMQNSSMLNGRSFTPRSDSVWNTQKHNSPFTVNSVLCKSPSSVSENVFIKPSFNKYQKYNNDDSDSELDESIKSLCIGSQNKSKKTNPIFSLRKFTATPSFVVPTPLSRARPLISPSKLIHSASWVAGGYWGSDGDRQIFNINGSRSSSQSSGFESQTSSLNHRNIFSQPPSREESICGEPMMIDSISSCQTAGFSRHQNLNYSSVSSTPVFPQMQFNGYVHIPQPHYAVPQSMHSQQQKYVQNNTFKIPGGSALIKLPQVNLFSQ